MIDIVISKVQTTLFGKELFKDISLEVKQGEKIALLGDNGVGKTTLFRVLIGEENYQHGSLQVRKNAKIGYLKQKIKDYGSMTANDVLNSAFKEISHISKQIKDIEKKMTSNSEDIEKLLNKYGRLQEKYESMGGYNIEERMSKVVVGLSIKDLLEKDYKTLSGGEKMRISLAKILVEEPDVLLLDEPTNHLDIDTSMWLEKYLNDYNGSVLMISHDRYFLNKVVNKIYEIKNGYIESYFGNYDYYLEEKESRYQIKLKNYKTQQKKINQLENAAKNMRGWARQADNEKMHYQAEALEKRIDRIERIERPVRDLNDIEIAFKSKVKAGKFLLSSDGHSVIIGEKTLVDDINFKIYSGEKIGLIGSNGCGKSTFIKNIIDLNNLDLRKKDDQEIFDNSKLKINPRSKIGYLQQDIKFPNEAMTILEILREYHPMSESQLRNYLAKFKFRNDEVFKLVSTISGGERVRLMLAVLMKMDINFLILDEPTNHIDIKTRETFEEALDTFEGTVLLISHDRYLLDHIADRIFEIRDKGLNTYIGGFKYYLEEIDKRK